MHLDGVSVEWILASDRPVSGQASKPTLTASVYGQILTVLRGNGKGSPATQRIGLGAFADLRKTAWMFSPRLQDCA
jgi:hypothetical protein